LRLDVALSEPLGETADAARLAERLGFGGVWASELGRDPLLACAVAAGATRRIEIGTAVVVAFGRSPMTVATGAWEIAGASGGRFVLGLGSQIRPHIEKRYSMPWSSPVPRMRDYVSALRDIWAAWRTGERLRHRSEHYTHILMTPAFMPPPHAHAIPIGLAAVGPRMTALAGEVADGLVVHPFTNPAYFDAVTAPALAEGLARSGRRREDVWTQCAAFVVAEGEPETESVVARTRRSIAFYGSTPSYRGVLEAVGRGELYERLHDLSRAGRWGEMATLVDDELLDAFTVRGPAQELPARLEERWGGRLDRVAAYYGWPARDRERLGAGR
jgi:probable F420-dependent oxidoreductase